MRWGLEFERVLVAGNSGNDAEMLSGEMLGVVVGNYSKEVERLRGRERIYFAKATHARGIIEGMDYYDFLGEIKVPEVVEMNA
jgi:sucrose-phosphate synthase